MADRADWHIVSWQIRSKVQTQFGMGASEDRYLFPPQRRRHVHGTSVSANHQIGLRHYLCQFRKSKPATKIV